MPHSLLLSCSSSTWCCHHCLKVNSLQDVLCEECELPRMDSFNAKADESQPKPGLSDGISVFVVSKSSNLNERLFPPPPARRTFFMYVKVDKSSQEYLPG